jgi:hypothetical protein
LTAGRFIQEGEVMSNAIYEQLLEYVNTLNIVDSHEHLISEQAHLGHYISFFHYFSSYLQWDLYSAGMPRELIWAYPKDEADELRYWKILEPLWPFVKYGSYARPIRLALQEFHGVADLNRENVLVIGQQMRANNYKGRYDEIFTKARISHIINQSPEHPFDDPRFVYGRPVQYFQQDDLQAFLKSQPSAGLDDLVGQIDTDLALAKTKGAVSAKLFCSNFLRPPSRELAEQGVAALRRDEPCDWEALQTYLYEQTVALCAKHDLIACVHTGVWTNLNRQGPDLVFPIVERNPDVTFDIYHMGLPFARECAFIGKNFPNANLNLCWAHAVSERLTLSALDEWLDLVPTNKISGFGGDLITVPEHVWGMLQVAKENLARAMARRIARERLDLDGARQILKLWLHDNPLRIYKIA